MPRELLTWVEPALALAIPAIGVLAAGLAAATPVQAADPLSSWNDTAAKKAIVGFVARVTTEGSPDFVPAAERIAVFDNDGTLWSEQPIYFQLAFTLDRIKALAPQHPEWKEQEPFASLLKGDLKAGARGRGAGRFRDPDGHACGHDDRGVREDRRGLDRDRQASEDRPALHGDGLSADAGAAGLPARERLQDFHRLRRRDRVHAALGGEGLRHPPRAGRRQQHQDEVRAPATAEPVLVRLPE